MVNRQDFQCCDLQLICNAIWLHSSIPSRIQTALIPPCLINSINWDHQCLELNTIIRPHDCPTAVMLLTASSLGVTSEAKDFAIMNFIRNSCVAYM
jgi:hypothetical protein